MTLKNFKVDVEATFGATYVVNNGKEKKLFVNGKPTDETKEIEYSVLATKVWETITVRVNEQVPSVKFEGEPILVKIESLEARIWTDNETKAVNVSLIADRISVVENVHKNPLKIRRENINE